MRTAVPKFPGMKKGGPGMETLAAAAHFTSSHATVMVFITV